MKQDVIKKRPEREIPLILSVLRSITYFFFGMLAARSAVLGSYAPFGISLAAVCPKKQIMPVLLGAVIGHLLPTDVSNPLIYISAEIAVAGIRWAFDGLKITKKSAFAPVAAFIATAGTGITVMLLSDMNAFELVMRLTDSILAGCGAFFVGKTLALLDENRTALRLNGQELSSVVITFGIFLIALCSLNINNISPGRIIAVVLVMICAGHGGVSGGAVAGVSSGIVMSLAVTDMNHLTGAYAFGGLMAGVFSPLGRIGCSLAFIVANGVGAITVGGTSRVVASLYEVFAGTLIFMLLPQRVISGLEVFFSDGSDVGSDNIKDAVVSRLRTAAKALEEVSTSVETVSRKLLKIKSNSLNEVYDNVVSSVCDSCGQKNICWNSRFSDTMNVFNDFSLALKRNGRLLCDELPDYFTAQCENPKGIVESINRCYDEYIQKNDAGFRMEQIRQKLAHSFDGIGCMLKNLSEEFDDVYEIDRQSAVRVRNVFEGYKIKPDSIMCKLDRFSRMTVEVTFKSKDRQFDKFELCKSLSRVCDRSFDTPGVLQIDSAVRMIFCERANLELSFGAAQHACKSGSLCGDAFEKFSDGNGHMISVLSDGMGSGGRAAVDGAMTANLLSKLIAAGFSHESTLSVVNDALMIRGCDETLSTVDIFSFDTYTGRCSFIKAGAHFSFVKKGGRVIKVEGNSLPIGILKDVEYEKIGARLDDGDIVVLMSDGAGDTAEYIEKELERFQSGSAQRLAERLMDMARASRAGGHDDDITILTAIIKRSV